VNLGSVTKDAPAASRFLELNGQLGLLGVTASDVEHGAVRLVGHDQDGVSAAVTVPSVFRPKIMMRFFTVLRHLPNPRQLVGLDSHRVANVPEDITHDSPLERGRIERGSALEGE
jgi:hypothetical protein